MQPQRKKDDYNKGEQKMRSFIIALVFFIAVVSAVILNSFYATHIYDNLLENLENFPETADDSANFDVVDNTCRFIDDNNYYFSFTLPQNNVNELICGYSDTLQYLKSGDTDSYLASLEKTKIIIKQMRKSEHLSLYHIFFESDKNKKRYFPYTAENISRST